MLRRTRNCCYAPYSSQPSLDRVAVWRGAGRSKFVIDIFFSKTENRAIFLGCITHAIIGLGRMSPSLTKEATRRRFTPKGPRNPLKRLDSDKEMQANPKAFLWRGVRNWVRDGRIRRRLRKTLVPFSVPKRGGAQRMSGRFAEPARAR